MKNSLYSLLFLTTIAFAVSGCATTEFNKGATDVALAGTGGVLGYKLSNGSAGGTAAGAVAGYLVSKVAQSSYQHSLKESEKTGYDRAMNQAVKQQYWIIQNQQKSIATETESPSRLVPIVVPETKINGVIAKAHIEYLRIEP